MSTRHFARSVLAPALLSFAPALAQQTTRVSVDSAGAEANSTSFYPSLSADGRYVAFASYATNLVAGDTNGVADVFVRDRASGQTTRASVSTAGAQANGDCFESSISADGRFVAFSSAATNLVAGDNNGVSDVFVRDRWTGQTTRVSVDSSGVEGNGLSGGPAISGNGRCVAFFSGASNLVAGDTNSDWDVFVHDRLTGQTTRVSVDSSGGEGHGVSAWPSISSDGRYVAFESLAAELVALDTNGARDIFVHDRLTGQTTRASVDSFGAEASAGGQAASISADGRWVSFSSGDQNLVSGDTNGYWDVFVHDQVTGQTSRVSVDSNGLEGNGFASVSSLSADGRRVAFRSNATNLVPNDTNGAWDVFVHDRQSGATTRVSVDSIGAEANDESDGPKISGDGLCVAFYGFATNLVAGDANGSEDVFVNAHPATEPITYCTAGTTSNGCVPSIGASANPDVAHTTPCVITVGAVEGQRSGIVFYGLAALAQDWCAGGAGTSTLCVKAPTYRASVQSSGGTLGQCDGSLSLDWRAFQLAHPAGLGTPWTAGETAYVQGWFRDPVSCKGTNLSDAVKLTYQP